MAAFRARRLVWSAISEMTPHNLGDGLGVFIQFCHIFLQGQRLFLYSLDAVHGVFHNAGAFFGALFGGRGHVGGRTGVFGHFKHGGVHFVHGRGGFSQARCGVGRPAIRLLDLSRKFRRGRGYHSGHLIQPIGGRQHAFRFVPASRSAASAACMASRALSDSALASSDRA